MPFSPHALPPELKLYFVRHGETDFNVQKIVQGGGIDSDLNETGRRQAEAFYQFYRQHAFEGVYVSSLKRTSQTLNPFAQNGHNLHILDGFNEMNWGVMEGRPATPEVIQTFREVLAEWQSGNVHYRVQNGESPVEVWDRANQALETIFTRHTAGNVLICSHGRTLRVILAQLLGYGLENMQLFEHDNTGVYTLSRQGAKVVAHTFNDLSHLKTTTLETNR